MAQHFKVHELLSREELDNLEAFAREPGRTIDECHEWLQGHGFTIGRSAVGTWLRKFRMQDQYRVARELANSLVSDVAKSGGIQQVSEATTLQISTMVFQKALSLQAQDESKTETKELLQLAQTARELINTAKGAEEYRSMVVETVAKAERDAKEGKSAGDVVDVIKKSLGII